MKIGLFGTFDVDNFGDLLFPLVVEKELPNFSIECFSPTNIETSFTDAKRVNKIEPLDFSIDAILIGGGNIIRVGNSSLDTYQEQHVNHTAYSDLWLNLIACNMNNTLPIIWNSPGVPDPLPNYLYNNILEVINRSDYISVRDSDSKGFIEGLIGEVNKINVVPDTVWGISRLISKAELTDRFFNLKKIDKNKNYFTLHFNDRYILENDLEEIFNLVKNISIKYSMVPIIMAVGNCHGDGVLARKISENIEVDHVLIDKPDSLMDMLSIFANTTLYIGSSMHGLITTSAYGNAAICIAKGKIKFEGIQNLFLEQKVIYDSWSDIANNYEYFNFKKMSETSKAVTVEANKKLEIHWNKIRELLNSSNSVTSLQSIKEKSNSFLSKYVTDFELTRKEYNRKIRNYECHIKELNSKIEIEKENYELLSSTLDKVKNNSEDLIKKIRKQNREIIKTNQVLQRFDVRFIIRVSNFLGKIPFAKSLFFKIKSIKHKLNETGITINKDVQRREGEDKNSSSWELTDECLAQLESYNKSKSRKKKYALITAQFGSYEQLVLPLNISKEFDYICFTDSSHNTYGLWQLRQSPFFHKDPVRMARYVKTHINSLLPEYEAVIWCDANIRVSNEIYLKFDGFLASDSDISLISHPHRTNIFEEAEACVRLSKDEGHIIYKQIDRYKDEKVGYSTGLYETGLHFVNLTSPMLSEFYKLWWKEIINGSRRDQIAIVYAIEKSKLKISDLFEPGVCVRTSNHTQIIQHSILKYMSTPKQLSKYNSIEDPTHSKTFRSDLGIDKTTDIIICVYNALEDVKLCLNSVLECSLNDVNKVIIIDDCSSKDTSEYLKMVVSKYNKLVLIRNELNQGYTKSANIGLKTSDADFRIILNSDTIVTQGWIKKLSALAFSHDNIGIVGPISNAAGSQSVPSIKKSDKNQTAINMLPKGYTINDMNNVAEGGLFQYPTIPLIHGFCIGIKRTVIDEIGFFDEVNFARYYGEENDYCLRAYKAGFDLKIATDTYIFHSKSKSIEEEERILHMSEAGRRLREIYGSQEMRDYCFQLDNNPVLVEVRDYFDKRCYS